MSEKIILLASIILGAAGGIAWSDAPSAERASPRATPAAQVVAPATDLNVHYSGCNEVRALGKAPLHKGDPGYSESMDGDGDGIACEPHRRG